MLRIVDLMHREKNIPKDIIFEGIEAALQLATEKHFGEEEGVTVTIDRDSGSIVARKGEKVIEPEELARMTGACRRRSRRSTHGSRAARPRRSSPHPSVRSLPATSAWPPSTG